MAAGDPPNNNFGNLYGGILNQPSTIYIGDPPGNQNPDSAGNHFPDWLQQQPPQYVPYIQTQPVNPFTITIVEPKDGDIKWDMLTDSLQIYLGYAAQWVPVLSGRDLANIYGEVKSGNKIRNTFEDRFKDIICEAEGITIELSEEEKQKQLIAEVTKSVMESVRKALERFQSEMASYSGTIYSTSTGVLSYGTST